MKFVTRKNFVSGALGLVLLLSPFSAFADPCGSIVIEYVKSNCIPPYNCYFGGEYNPYNRVNETGYQLCYRPSGKEYRRPYSRSYNLGCC